MTYPKAFILSALIIAMALIFSSTSKVSSQMPSGSYMIAGDSGQFAWRVNTETGAVSYCVRRDNSIDPGLMKKRPPFCSAESPALMR